MAAIALAIASTGPAHAAWHVASSEHFVIYSEEKPDSLRAYAEKLERFDYALRMNQTTPLRPALPGNRLTIFALGSAAAVQKVMGRGAGDVAGVYRPNVTGSIALTMRSARDDPNNLNTQNVLLHEYAHHFMLSNFPASYPAWFVEGYAEFNATARFEDNGDISLGLPARHRGYELSLAGNMPIEAMMAGRYPDTALLDAKGWLLTHYLTFEPSRKGQLATFLKTLGQGKFPVDAAKESFGNLGRLDRELDAYLDRKTLSYITVAAKRIPPVQITVSDVPAGEAAMMTVRMNSRFGVDAREARQRAEEARRLAAPFSADAAVQCALAEAQDDAHDLDGTDTAADRLLALDAKSICGLIFKGRVAMGRAIEAKAAPDDAAWAAARGWFTRANRADPENPWPMWLYYQSFLAAKSPPTANAVLALLAAQQRAPQDPNLRLLATVQLLRDRRADDARVMLAPMISSSHGTAAKFQALYGRIGQEDSRALADELEGGGAPKK